MDEQSHKFFSLITSDIFPAAMFQSVRHVQSRAEVSGRTGVYHNQTGPGYPSALARRDMPGVVGCAASQRCQAAQHPLQTD